MVKEKKIKVGVIGSSGFVGEELLLLINQHSQIDLCAISSRELAGKDLTKVFHNLAGKFDLSFSHPEDDIFTNCEALFLAMPHGKSMSMVNKFVDQGIKVIDLSADFRIPDSKVWSDWYGSEHTNKELLSKATYGLVEVNSKAIADSDLVSVPGCYPTASLLGLLPMLKSSAIINNITIDAKSGISGAGRNAVENGLARQIKDNFRAYSVGDHRHYPEIENQISTIYGKELDINFLTHLIPIFRGLYASLYIQTKEANETELKRLYESFYEYSPSVEILKDRTPELSEVINTNKCHISLNSSYNKDQIIIISCIDNLLKGAAGQAIQCFNLMFNFEVNTGLN